VRATNFYGCTDAHGSKAKLAHQPAMEPPAGDGDAQDRQRQDGDPTAATAPVVSLRPLGLADADAFMAWASDDRVMRFLKRPLCATACSRVAQIRDTVLGHPWFGAVCVGGRPVGQVSVWPYADEGGRRANLGYALARDHWGRGIAAAAIRMVTTRSYPSGRSTRSFLDHGVLRDRRNSMRVQVVGRVFDDLPGLERLEAVTDVENVRSQRVLEKAGFQREGVLRRYIAGRGGGQARDAVIYSFLSSDRL
jgi:RimJ/RimL family protein N-acetyltransferase